MRAWLALAGGVAAVVLLVGAYFFGRSDGKAIEVAAQARAEAAVKLEREQREDRVDQVGAAAALAETTRTGNVREIYRESHSVIEKPVYRNMCVDADGVRLLDQAALVASGADPGGDAAKAGGGAPPAP